MNQSRRIVLKFLSKEGGCWKEILKMRSVVRGLIKKLDLALAKEVRIEVLADWGSGAVIVVQDRAKERNEGEEWWLEVVWLKRC